jgi:replicative DNA helicase
MEADAELLGAWQPAWEDAKKYYNKYRSIPDITVLQEKYPDLEEVKVKGASAHYLANLRSEYIQIRMKKLMDKADEKLTSEVDAPEKILGEFQAQLSKLNRYTNSVRDLDITDYEQAEKRIKATHERAESMGGRVGIATGVDFVDQAYITGMAPGHMIVIIGWPGKAKTWGATHIACNAFAAGYKPMIVSLEMTPENMADRIYTTMGSGLFSASDFATGDINLDKFRKFAQKRFPQSNRFSVVSNDGINDVTPNIIQGKIEQHHPDLVILDYAQLMSDNRKSEGMTARMMNLSREVKNLAVVNNLPVILITAATAEERSDREQPPLLSSVAWSKSIEYDADMAIAIHKHDGSNLVEWTCRKNRHGVLFDGMLDWEIDTGIIKSIYN